MTEMVILIALSVKDFLLYTNCCSKMRPIVIVGGLLIMLTIV